MKQLFCLLLSIWSIATYGQTITITDAESNQPLEFVTLFSESPKFYTSTNAKGQADISKFRPSKNIQIRSMGFEQVNFTFQELKEKNFSVALQKSGIQMEMVIVSANRWEQSTAEIPSKISSISTEEIAMQNPQTAADLLAISGNVFIQKSQQGGGSPMIRGFATNRLVYSIDGVRMNTAIFRGGNIQNVISLDPFAMERTEVVLGASSVIYGSDAIGGVMAFQTLEPQLSLTEEILSTTKAVARYSSANQENSFHFSTQIGGEKWASVTSLTFNKYGNLTMGSKGPDDYLRPVYVERINGQDVVVDNPNPKVQNPSGFSQHHFMQKIRFQANPNWNFQYGLHYSETSDYARYDRHQRFRNELPRYGEWSYGPQIWMMNHVSVEHSTETFLYEKASLSVAQQNFQESRLSRNFNSEEREIRNEEVDAFSVNLDFEKELGSKKEFRYGMEYVSNLVQSDGINENILSKARLAGPSRYPNSTWSSQSVYAMVEYGIGETNIVQGGLRWSSFSLESDFDTTFYPFPFSEASILNSNVTGSIGLVSRPINNLIIKSNVSTAYRTPNVDDVGKVFDSEPGAVTVPNPELEEEYAVNMDLGFAYLFKNTYKIEATGFYTRLNNAMVRRNTTLNGQDSILYDGALSQVQSIQNAAVANVYGVNFGLEYDLGNGFKFSSDYNIQIGKEELDNGQISPSRHAAPNFGISRLGFRKNRTYLELYAQYVSEVSAQDMPISEQGKTEIYALNSNGEAFAPAWTTINFKGSYTVNDHIMVTGGLENILDIRYRPYSSGISAPGRNFIISLRLK